MLTKISEIIPKSLVPITVLIVGFAILLLAMLLTKFIMKILNKFDKEKRK